MTMNVTFEWCCRNVSEGPGPARTHCPSTGHRTARVATSSLVKCSCSTTFKRSSFSIVRSNKSKNCKVMFLFLSNGWRFPVVLHGFPSLRETELTVRSLKSRDDVATEWLAHLLRFQRVLGSNPGPATGYSDNICRGYSQSLHAVAGMVP
jgi:hypothetical protein